MKIYIFAAVVAFVALTTAVFVPPRPGYKQHLLGSKECTWGPSYWCKNLTAASGCHAVKHCIQTVWEHQKLPEDNSSICQICLDMVKQARDQLESNETQEELKEVFEGSCKLIPLKPIAKECIKLSDDYIPDLVDTLASEMNPQVVCSVAGLCNNERVHQLLKDAGEDVTKPAVRQDNCQGCHTVINAIENKFNKQSRDDVLNNFLEVCRTMSSFSDACSNIVVTYFQDIYAHLQNHLNSNEVCIFSGECSAQFHKHTTNVEITPLSDIGFVPVKKTDVAVGDETCAMCEQLVWHLRDILVSQTTKEEFKQVMDGLCKATGKFSDECLSIVAEYYSSMYDYLVNNLDPRGVCTLVGICSPVKESKLPPIAPLLTPENAKLITLPQVDKESVNILPQEPVLQQLPIERLMPPHTQVLYNKEVCEFCQYFLHYLQQAITEPKTEDKIKQEIDKACALLPASVNTTCINFVDSYEPALVAILAQEIDPSQVCPMIRACPNSDNKDVEIFMEAKGDSKCPLCLLAVTKLEDMVKDEKTEASIEAAIKKVCKDLPSEMVEGCENFVDKYTLALVEMILADLKPEEVCVYLKFCTDSRPASPLPPYVYKHVSGNIETNIIPDNTINGKVVSGHLDLTVEEDTECVLCEFIMKEVDDQLKDNKTDQEIKDIVKDICKVMPTNLKNQCNDMVDKYGDQIIQLLISAAEPKDICRYIGCCKANLDAMRIEILECPVCQLTVEAMKKILDNPKVDHTVEHVLEKTCRGLPQDYKEKCVDIIEKYGETMIDMLVHYADKDFVCQKIGCCKSALYEIVID